MYIAVNAQITSIIAMSWFYMAINCINIHISNSTRQSNKVRSKAKKIKKIACHCHCKMRKTRISTENKRFYNGLAEESWIKNGSRSCVSCFNKKTLSLHIIFYYLLLRGLHARSIAANTSETHIHKKNIYFFSALSLTFSFRRF